MGKIVKIFSHSVGYRFTLMMVSFAVQKLWSLIRSHLYILAFIAIAFGVLVMKSLPCLAWNDLGNSCPALLSLELLCLELPCLAVGIAPARDP